MIHFNLNIDLFYDFELKKDSIVKCIACIEYPVIHIIAKTKETIEEEFDELDKFIVKSAIEFEGLSVSELSTMTGLSPNVFEFRAKELDKQELITYENENIIPTSEGVEYISNEKFERNIIKTRSFLLDGYTHQPMKSYFYREGKDNLISEEERDSWGNKLFNPAIIHTPPTKRLNDLITEIPIEDRNDYNIPIGLRTIIDYDFKLMTYPIGIVLSTTSTGAINKRIVDINGFYANEDCIIEIQNLLKDEINNLEIIVEEKETKVNESIQKKIHFKNSWSKTNISENKRIFNLTQEKAKYFIQRLYNIESLNDNNFSVTDRDIVIKVDLNLFESKNIDKKKLIAACVRKRDYYRQYEGTGVWLVFWELQISDEYVQKLVDLYMYLQLDESIDELLKYYGNNYKILRRNLIAIEQYEILEELDIFLYMHVRETDFRQNFLTLNNG